jgi:GyrI-like small molecule binding protein
LPHNAWPCLIESRVLPEQATASVRASLLTDQLDGWLCGAYEAILAYLAQLAVTPAGPPFARYRMHDGPLNGLLHVEAGFPVRAPVPGQGHIHASALPGGPVAVTTHHGHYEHLTPAYQNVVNWLAQHHYRTTGVCWEVYDTDPQARPDPAGWRTELVVPYRDR